MAQPLLRLTIHSSGGPQPRLPLWVATVPALALTDGQGVRFHIEPTGWGHELQTGFTITAAVGENPPDWERQRLVRAGWLPPGEHCHYEEMESESCPICHAGPG